MTFPLQSVESHYLCNLSLWLRASNKLYPLPPAMHLFGLNWQLQQTENDTFENGKVNSNTVPTHPVTVPAGENGK